VGRQGGRLGDRVHRDMLRSELTRMINLSQEFAFYLLVSWSCFASGIWAIRYSHVPDLVYLGRYLIALCPIILSLFCNHSVSVCEQVILSKKNEAESVSGRVYLTSISSHDLGDGYAWTTERYSDGTVRASGQVRSSAGCDEGELGETQGDSQGIASPRRSLVPMQTRSQPIEYGADFRASVF
jgi:hypothetical protein